MMGRVGTSLKFLATAGAGLFGDGYLNLGIGLVAPILGYLYFPDGKVPPLKGDIMKGCLSIGMICGQITFGIFGDALGRHRIYGKELILTITGTLLLILIPWRNFNPDEVVAWVGVFRLVTGMGIGGDYPMTSALSMENDIFKSRSKLVLSVFTVLGIGEVTVGIVYLILLFAFKSSVQNHINHLQWVWRLLFGIGLIPLICSLYSRLTMRESKAYEKYVATETSLSDPSKRGAAEQFRDFRAYFSNWHHSRTLLATSLSWFLFDIAYYGINLNQSIILARIGFTEGNTPWEVLYRTAVGNIIVSFAGYLPGYFIAIPLPDLIGRVRQQCIFSALVAIIYAIWAGISNIASTGVLIALFTISQLVLNAGPNATTWLIPAEVFPTRVRGTAHGISAASGKIGAVLTAFAFGSAVEAMGLQGTLGFLAGVMTLCAIVSLWIPEVKGLSLDDIENDLHYEKVLGIASVAQAGSEPSFETTGTKSPVEARLEIGEKYV